MPEIQATPAGSRSSSRLFELRAEAMAATFRIQVVEDDAVYARQAAAAALEEVYLLAGLLSRFEESSDISRINALQAGQSVRVALETFDCLQIALGVQRMTHGAFDVTYGSEGTPAEARLRLDPAGCHVQALVPGLRVDLGGIGKGFALDRMARLLRQWDIRCARLWASTSTALAYATPPRSRDWTVDFGPAADRRQVSLQDSAFSASGTALKGAHVIDPKTRLPVQTRRRAWAAAPTAAVADALSTAFLVMSRNGIQHCCAPGSRISAYIAEPEEDLLAAYAEWEAGCCPLEAKGT